MLSKKRTKDYCGRPKKTSPETDRRMIVLTKNYLFKSSTPTFAEIDIEISTPSSCASESSKIARKVPQMRKQKGQLVNEHLFWPGKDGEKYNETINENVFVWK